jgi:hypothetical protein
MRTVSDICNTMSPKAGASEEQTVAWIESLFVIGQVSLRDGEASRPAGEKPRYSASSAY